MQNNPMEDHRGGNQLPPKGPIELEENYKMDAKVGKINHPMLPSAGIDALNPKPSHVAFLIATIPIRILQCLLHSLPGCPDTVLATTSEPLRQLQYLLVVHCDRCAFLSPSFFEEEAPPPRVKKSNIPVICFPHIDTIEEPEGSDILA
jgi:hypothetical protein